MSSISFHTSDLSYLNMNRLEIYNIVNKEQSRTLQKNSGGVIEWPCSRRK